LEASHEIVKVHEWYEIRYGLIIGSLVASLAILYTTGAVLSLQLDSTRECPYCISLVPRAARRCAFCGEALEPVTVSDGSANP